VLVIRRYWKTFQSEPPGGAGKIIGLKLELLYPVLNAKEASIWEWPRNPIENAS